MAQTASLNCHIQRSYRPPKQAARSRTRGRKAPDSETLDDIPAGKRPDLDTSGEPLETLGIGLLQVLEEIGDALQFVAGRQTPLATITFCNYVRTDDAALRPSLSNLVIPAIKHGMQFGLQVLIQLVVLRPQRRQFGIIKIRWPTRFVQLR